MAILIYRVSYGFTTLADGALNDFGATVSSKLALHKDKYPSPPVTPADLDTLGVAFTEAIAAAAGGGKAATAAKKAARQAVVDALRKNATYVQLTAENDLSTMLDSGFKSTSTNRTPTTLTKVEVVKVENAQTGELKVRVKPVRNAKSFTGRIKPATGSEFGPSISFKNSKSILFDGLTAGVTYVLQVCAVGGTTGTSDWSDPVSHMSM